MTSGATSLVFVVQQVAARKGIAVNEYMRLMRSAQSAEDTGRGWQMVLEAVVRLEKRVTPNSIEADVVHQEVERLRELVKEMNESAAVDYAAAQNLKARNSKSPT